MTLRYELTEAQFDKLMDASKPVLQTSKTSTQKNANNAWKALGKELGFQWMTVRPTGEGDRFFMADPL